MSPIPAGLCVGVDGGGTSTVALVGRAGDLVLGRGEAGPSNPQTGGFDVAAAQIAAAIHAALVRAGVPAAGLASLERATLGIAGTGLPDARARLAAVVAARLGVPEARLRLLSDIALVLPSAGLGVGVALVAGTGSAAFGVAPDGRTALAGGWGHLWGDEGSAFDVGRQALRAIARADDGLAPPTSLTPIIIRHFGLGQPRELVSAVYQSATPRRAIAALAPLVVDAARSGDPVARRILARAARELGRLACAVATRLELGPGARVAGAGGLFRAGDLLLDPLAATLARASLTDLRLAGDPALGALRLATGDVPMPLADPH